MLKNACLSPHKRLLTHPPTPAIAMCYALVRVPTHFLLSQAVDGNVPDDLPGQVLAVLVIHAGGRAGRGELVVGGQDALCVHARTRGRSSGRVVETKDALRVHAHIRGRSSGRVVGTKDALWVHAHIRGDASSGRVVEIEYAMRACTHQGKGLRASGGDRGCTTTTY